MDEKDKIVVGFITEMLKTAPDDYMEIKLIMLAVNAEKPAVLNF